MILNLFFFLLSFYQFGIKVDIILIKLWILKLGERIALAITECCKSIAISCSLRECLKMTFSNRLWYGYTQNHLKGRKCKNSVIHFRGIAPNIRLSMNYWKRKSDQCTFLKDYFSFFYMFLWE